MQRKRTQSIGDIYGDMLNSVKTVKIDESVKEGGNDFSDNDPAPLIDGGPQKEGGYNDALEDNVANFYGFDEDEEGCKDQYNDLDQCCEHGSPSEQCKCGADEDEEDEDVEGEEITDDNEMPSEDEEEDMDDEGSEDDISDDDFVSESRKFGEKTLNTVMSRKKLSFDSIYKQVINENFGEDDSDLDAFGLTDATPDSDLDEDFGGEEEGGDEVTVTLDKATAQALLDVLQGVLDAGEEDMGEEVDVDELDFEGETGDGEADYEEDEETLGDKKGKLQGKDNKVGNVKPGSASASSAVTDKVGNDGDHGHALHGAKAPNDGKNNKVGSVKQGQDLFQ